jgi:hypothetical protein
LSHLMMNPVVDDITKEQQALAKAREIIKQK